MTGAISLTSPTKKETLMRRFVRWPLAILALIWISLSLGCETPRPASPPVWTSVEVNNMSDVAGKWEGILRRVPQNKRNDLVALFIEPNGQFRFTSVRTIGILSGEGTFTLKGGKLTFSSERFTINADLFEADGKRMLRAEGMASDGMAYSSELTQAR